MSPYFHNERFVVYIQVPAKRQFVIGLNPVNQRAGDRFRLRNDGLFERTIVNNTHQAIRNFHTNGQAAEGILLFHHLAKVCENSGIAMGNARKETIVNKWIICILLIFDLQSIKSIH